jgi:hypothetical protein
VKHENLRARQLAVAAPVVVAAVVLAFHGPIPQDPEYHRFADTRTLAGIPNAGDVLSNIALAAAGAIGLWLLTRGPRAEIAKDRQAKIPYFVFFGGVFLAAFGSAYYHWAPDNPRLFWDRLPMTLAFTSLFVAVVDERVSSVWAGRLLIPLLVLGAFSVVYWRWTETAGHGDLRLYALVQYGLILSLGIALLLFPSRSDVSISFIWVAAAYALAKICELADFRIFRLTGWVSGHTLKHIMAGAAAGLVALMLASRRALKEEAR